MRFREAVLRFSAFFDSMEALMGGDSLARQVFEQTIFGREIRNVIGCEGLERLTRCETLEVWQRRMQGADFTPAPPSAGCVAMLLRLAKGSHQEYEIAQTGGGLKLVWRGVPLVNAAAWTCR